MITTTWETIGFKTGNSILVIEDVKTGNILFAKYSGGDFLNKDQIEEELF